MTTTLCVSGVAVFKAGKNVNPSITDTQISVLINEAEAYLCNVTHYDWIGNYASLDADNKKILEEACSALVAMYLINYDMSNYTSRLEVQTMLDVLNDRVKICVDLLKNPDYLAI